MTGLLNKSSRTEGCCIILVPKINENWKRYANNVRKINIITNKSIPARMSNDIKIS